MVAPEWENLCASASQMRFFLDFCNYSMIESAFSGGPQGRAVRRRRTSLRPAGGREKVLIICGN
jgi:hypothetical protein